MRNELVKIYYIKLNGRMVVEHPFRTWNEAKSHITKSGWTVEDWEIIEWYADV
jgi:hypothetical protein